MLAMLEEKFVYDTLVTFDGWFNEELNLFEKEDLAKDGIVFPPKSNISDYNDLVDKEFYAVTIITYDGSMISFINKTGNEVYKLLDEYENKTNHCAVVFNMKSGIPLADYEIKR